MTNILGILTWFVSKKDYIAGYANDEDRQKIAKRLFNSVDEASLILVLVMLVLTALICCFYHFPYNNRPGRHYRPFCKRLFFLGTLVLVFAVTMVCYYFMAKNPGFDWMLLAKAYLMNTGYAALVYIMLTSLINYKGKSNAYPSWF